MIQTLRRFIVRWGVRMLHRLSSTDELIDATDRERAREIEAAIERRQENNERLRALLGSSEIVQQREYGEQDR